MISQTRSIWYGVHLFIFSANSDFNGPLGVTFAAGTENGAVMNARLTVINDDDVEGTETVVLMASVPPGVKAFFPPGEDRVTIPIWDNDGKYHSVSVASPCIMDVRLYRVISLLVAKTQWTL